MVALTLTFLIQLLNIMFAQQMMKIFLLCCYLFENRLSDALKSEFILLLVFFY